MERTLVLTEAQVHELSRLLSELSVYDYLEEGEDDPVVDTLKRIKDF